MIVKLLANVGKKLIEIEHLEAFISMVMAGLGTEGSLMKADAIVTVAVLVDTFYASLTPGFVSEVTSIVLMMLREHNNEIYKSVLTYLQHLCKAHKRNKISDQVTLK
jgi:ribosomal RNA-processing protein 12